MFKNRCYNGGSKHRFCPRYHTIGMTDTAFKSLENMSRHIGTSAARVAEAGCTLQYVHDVCVWCGKINKEGV